MAMNEDPRFSDPRVFGLWNGGSSYSLGDLVTNGETWESLEDAKDSLVERYLHGYWMRENRARVLNFDEDGIATLGFPSDDLRPVVSEETSIILYPAERVGVDRWRISDEPYAEITLEPNGHGARVETF